MTCNLIHQSSIVYRFYLVCLYVRTKSVCRAQGASRAAHEATQDARNKVINMPSITPTISKKKKKVSRARSCRTVYFIFRYINFLAMSAKPPPDEPPPRPPEAMRTASPTRPTESPDTALDAVLSMRSIMGGMRRPKRASRAVRKPPVMRGMMTRKKTFQGWRLAQWTRSRNRRFTCLNDLWTKPWRGERL